MFTVGIGPSSSHTVGPMRAGRHFAELLQGAGLTPSRVRVRLFGSLAATGMGHGTDRAVLLGLGGAHPETVETDQVDDIMPNLVEKRELPLLGGETVPFELHSDLLFEPKVSRQHHVNALTIEAWDDKDEPTLSRTYYSIGGGFILVEDEDGVPVPPTFTEDPKTSNDPSARSAAQLPLPFTSAAELLDQCEKTGLSIAEVVTQNEGASRTEAQIEDHLRLVTETMFASVKAGCETRGVLPGWLQVSRRAPELREKLQETLDDPLAALDWVTLYALAVNEENAAGHRVVTAPTNGAAGIVPAVLGHFLITEAAERVGDLAGVAKEADLWDLAALLRAYPDLVTEARDFLLAATAIGSIIKTNASIAGAEVGCQGEVGSASAMAAAGLAQALGGTPLQVENAAEIAMEHSLGLTCDPVGGLVQIPCIERNAIGGVKAISAARMALHGDGRHHVTLDVAVETMRQTGMDMLSKYKETSVGGLAVNVVEC